MDIKKMLVSEYEKRGQIIEKRLEELEKQLKSKETVKPKEIVKSIQSKPTAKVSEIITIVNQLNEVSNKVDKLSEKLDKRQYEKLKTKTDKLIKLALDIISLPLKDRKEILRKLKFTKRVTDTPAVFVKGKAEVKKAIIKMSNMKESEGAVIKELSAPYSFGKTKKTWIKFRKLVDVHVRILERVPKKKGLFNYLVGIDLKEKELKTVNPAKVKEVGTRKVLVLGHTFNTKEKVDENKIIDIMLEEVWRHETKNGLHYSIHKPRFRQLRHDLNTTSTVNDLEDIVTSIGVAVKGFEFAAKDIEEAKKTIRDWPKWIQAGLRAAMEKNIWLPYVIQHHYRGTTVKEKDKYEYNLRSIHSDFRHFIPKNIDKIKENTVVKYEDAKKIQGMCYGVTVNTPPSVDKTDEWDNNVKHILCEGKLPIPKGWLYVEDIADINEPGSSWYGGRSIAPGLIVRAGYGEALPLEITDHIIRLKFRNRSGDKNMKLFEEADRKGILIENKFSNKLKSLEGEFEFTINHIGDKWLIFLNKVKAKGRKQAVTKEMMNKIFELTEQDPALSRSEIAEAVGISVSSIYNYQKQMGLL